MPETFERFRCWTTERVQESVFGDIASLRLDADAVFLAAHTSLAIRHVKGAHIEADTPEQGVLRALTGSFGSPDDNTTIAITGASGSGKSHLVRWLRAHLDDNAVRYHLIYVPRELATLRELIGRVLDGLPPSAESDAVRQELDKAVAKKPAAQLAEELLDKVRSVVSFELPEGTSEGSDLRPVLLGSRASSPEDRRENGLGDLLLVRSIREHLLRPDGAITAIINSLRGQRSGRDEDTPEFGVADVKIRRAGIQTQLDAALQPVWRVVQHAPDAAVSLLNEALPRAVAETLGMRAGVNISEVFRKARSQLRDEGKDLVLLFEDLAQFGLFDGELFDQFVLQPGDALAPVRAVFAITDGKFRENVPDTVHTRLAHRFEIGNIDPDGADALGSPLTGLLARYLNVARVGRERLVEAWSSASEDERQTGTWVPNQCWDFDGGGECSNRETCWPAFGSVDGIGLYPYNGVAIRRTVAGSREPVTPRLVVDTFVHDFLIEADAEIHDGRFPSERSKQRFDFSVALSKDVIVPATDLAPDERNRLHRARVIWADGASEHRGIAEAFALPSAEGADYEPEPEPDEPRGRGDDLRRPRPLTPLFDWENGEPLPNKEAVYYRETLYALATARVDLNPLFLDRRAGPAALLLRRVVTPNSFEFSPEDPGRTAGKNQLRFEILPGSRGVRLLAAARWFWDHAHWDVTSTDRKWDFIGDPREAHLELEEFLAGCAQDIEGAIVACLLRGPLDPAAAAVALRTVALQTLGSTLPESTDALNFVLTDSPPLGHTPSNAWAPVQRAALDTLAAVDHAWVAAFATARQGDTGDAQAIDASRLVPAMDQARADPLAVLSSEPCFDEAFSALTEVWVQLRDALRSAVDAEAEDLVTVVGGISDRLGEADLAVAVPTIDSAGRLAADHRSFRPQQHFEAFRTACERLRGVNPAELASWREEVGTWTASEHSAASVVTAQRWASRARQVSQDLDTLAECLIASLDEVRDRLVHDLGETPDQVMSTIGERVADIAQVVKTMGKGS